jgi:integrase/recombinase XerD
LQSLSNEELLALLGAAKQRRQRDYLMILTAYWHGLRASEITGLRAQDVADGYITVRRLKGSLKTIQPLVEHPNSLLNERKNLESFVASCDPKSHLFPIGRTWFWRLIQKYAKLAGIPAMKAHPHALKHSIANHTIDIAGIQNVRQWLGHKSIASTGAYLRVTDDQAAAAINKASKGT